VSECKEILQKLSDEKIPKGRTVSAASGLQVGINLARTEAAKSKDRPINRHLLMGTRREGTSDGVVAREKTNGQDIAQLTLSLQKDALHTKDQSGPVDGKAQPERKGSAPSTSGQKPWFLEGTPLKLGPS